MPSSFSSPSSAVLFFCPSPDLQLLLCQVLVMEKEGRKCSATCGAASLSAQSVSSQCRVTSSHSAASHHWWSAERQQQYCGTEQKATVLAGTASQTFFLQIHVCAAQPLPLVVNHLESHSTNCWRRWVLCLVGHAELNSVLSGRHSCCCLSSHWPCWIARKLSQQPSSSCLETTRFWAGTGNLWAAEGSDRAQLVNSNSEQCRSS